jgi:alcohol-forming fatty acyl-CoA reductase
MLKVYKKIQRFSDVIAYFSTQQWNFNNKNMQALWSRMDPKDQEIFHFSMKDMDWENYFETHILGLRKYLAKDDPSTLPAARRRWFRYKFTPRMCNSRFYDQI